MKGGEEEEERKKRKSETKQFSECTGFGSQRTVDGLPSQPSRRENGPAVGHVGYFFPGEEQEHDGWHGSYSLLCLLVSLADWVGGRSKREERILSFPFVPTVVSERQEILCKHCVIDRARQLIPTPPAQPSST